ncbi:hypothetical protein [Adhaeribacter rhizoryzae]|uniref:Uncharacterized protein n=1 Tax=Adhaeribacter rhizoryzae TaxID=2607907 RepID=A0A5M6D6X1_9BACT|nr:hypothetical protein [Adhaeribacter rhizoryzae]KAA5541992.1 hypothetical protein F0145_19590 [Adhaeribacter rhizoryzae]
MFAGITWVQFGLFILVAVILYYSIILFIYYRSEIFGTLRKTSAPSDLIPSSAAMTFSVHSAIGATADYGNDISSPPGSDSFKNNDTENPPASDEPNNDPAQEEDSDLTGEYWKGEENLAEIQEQEEDLYFMDDIDLEEQFIPFAAGDAVEFVTGGIVLADLNQTVELLTQEEITDTEKGQLSKNLEIMEDTLLLQTLMTDNVRAKARVELLLNEALWEEEAPPKEPQEIKDSFSDLDVKKLLKQVH